MGAATTAGAPLRPAALASDLLRLATAGSVDDGKSTLIGRLLYDSRAILSDQLALLAAASRRRGGDGALDLALLTDGLRAEREQGITIDVAYRSFATPRRRFVIADTPGHVHYTRNMVTGASLADLALVLLDARRGVVEQSRRHAFIASLLRIPHLVVAVNKMDLVAYSEAAFAGIVDEFTQWAGDLAFASVTFVPLSALEGDNVVATSGRMPWYGGPALLPHLESVELELDEGSAARFPVQWVIRAGGDYRGYAGRLAGGTLARGDDVVVLPGERSTRVAAIETFAGAIERAAAPMSVTLRLADELDVSRGDLLCRPDEAPRVVRDLEAEVCWMADGPLAPGSRYLIKHTTRQARVLVGAVHDRVDVHTLERERDPGSLALNDIGRVGLRVTKPLALDRYAENRTTGSFILIDETTNETVGAGMVA